RDAAAGRAERVRAPAVSLAGGAGVAFASEPPDLPGPRGVHLRDPGALRGADDRHDPRAARADAAGPRDPRWPGDLLVPAAAGAMVRVRPSPLARPALRNRGSLRLHGPV